MRPKKATLRKPSHSATTGTREKHTAPPHRIGFVESFKALAAIASFVATVLGALVLYAGNKGAFADLADDFYGWLYEDEAWTGLFNNFPEGYVDMESMQLSETSMQIAMTVERGQIHGVISERTLCGVDTPGDFKLLKGEVSIFGRSARLVVWDIVGGYPRDYSTLTASLDGVVLDLKGQGDSLWQPHTPIKLGKHPELSADAAIETLNGYCSTEHQGPSNAASRMADQESTTALPATGVGRVR